MSFLLILLFIMYVRLLRYVRDTLINKYDDDNLH